MHEIWHAEYYTPGAARWPLGVAYLTVPRDRRHSVVLDYVFVIDEFRRSGIGAQLVKECHRKWPHLSFGWAFFTQGGEELIESLRRQGIGL